RPRLPRSSLFPYTTLFRSQSFNSNIVLSSTNLYERFGLDNGKQILSKFFSDVTCKKYHDAIEISEATPIISYILSCHGNQNEILLNHCQDSNQYAEQTVEDGFYITKDAGFFTARKEGIYFDFLLKIT